MDHICTNESLVAGGIDHKLVCPICCTESKVTSGYAGTLCRSCGFMWSSEDWRGSIAMMRRRYLKKNRKQMGELTGYSPMTIKQYEWVNCSKKYYEKTEEVIKEVNLIETK